MAFTLAQIEAEEKRRKGLGEDYIPYKSPKAIPEPEPKEDQDNEIGRFMSGVTGFNTGVERLAHGILQPFLGEREFFKNAVNRRERAYQEAQEANPKSTFAGELLGNIGAGIPFGGAGAGAAKLATNLPKVGKTIANNPYLRGILGESIGSGLMGGAEYVSPEESRAENALTGGGIGAVFGAASPVFGKIGSHALKGYDYAKDLAKKSYGRLRRGFGSEKHILDEMLEQYSNKELSEALKNQQAAKEIGITLTPAEAAKSEIGAAYEGGLGTSKKGERALYEFKKDQKQAQKEAIEALSHQINPSDENASEKIRNAAKKIISKKRKALQEKARPHYEAAEVKILPANKFNRLTKDANIEDAWKEVLKDRKYASEIEGFEPNSIKVLDEVKKRLDSQIKVASRAGDDHLAGILRGSKEKLVSALDKISPEYKKARHIYSKESPLIDLVRNREVGRIAKLKDSQIKNVSKIVFDPGQTDPRVMARLRDEFLKEDPESWSKLIRNAMENKISTVNRGTTGQHGTNFYRQIIADDKTYDRFYEALKGNKDAQKRLEQMKMVFQDLTNKPTVKGAHARAQNSMNKSRSSAQDWKKFILNLNGGKYDRAAVDIITNDKWQRAFFDAMMERSQPKRVNKLAKLLEKVDLEKPSKVVGRGVAGMATSTEKPWFTTENYEIY